MKTFVSILAVSMHLPAVFLFGGGGVGNLGSAPSASMKVAASNITVSFSPSAAVHNFQDANVRPKSYADGREEPREAVTAGHLTQAAETDDSSNAPDSKPLAALSAQADMSRSLEAAAMPGLLERSTLYYVPASELTRLPYPIEEIDLEQGISEQLTNVGQFNLTILIEENGMVMDVIAMGESAEFIERIKDRFRAAHFMPGEINGKAVKSLIQVTVVNEVPKQGY